LLRLLTYLTKINWLTHSRLLIKGTSNILSIEHLRICSFNDIVESCDDHKLKINICKTVATEVRKNFTCSVAAMYVCVEKDGLFYFWFYFLVNSWTMNLEKNELRKPILHIGLCKYHELRSSIFKPIVIGQITGGAVASKIQNGGKRRRTAFDFCGKRRWSGSGKKCAKHIKHVHW